MKNMLQNLAWRLLHGTVGGGVGLVVFTVFSREPLIRDNPMAMLATTFCCVVTPIAAFLANPNHGGGK